MPKTLIGYGYTDENGVATLDYDAEGHELAESGYVADTVGNYTLTAETEIDGETYTSSPSQLTVNPKPTPTITLSANINQITYGSTITLNGTISAGNGLSIKIYDGNTLVDTVTSGTNGAFSKTVSGLSVGNHTFKAVFEGNASYANAESSTVQVTVNKLNTSLEISVPLSLVYSDSFNITGTLMDTTNNTAMNNATVKLQVGNTVVDTQTTNSNGVVSFTQTPVSMGTHSFKLVYEGATNYNNTESSVVTRDINKETTVLTLTSPLDNYSTYTDGTITISGTLLTDDGEAINNKSIIVSKNGTTLTTLTTDNGGAFTGSVSGLSAGNHTLNVAFATDTNYTASSVNRTVTINSPTLTLASDKSILSYADSESATLTATYTGASVNNKSITFEVRKQSDDSLVETLIGTTNSSGIATVSYLGKHTNSINIQAKSNNITSTTISIEDCILYDPSSSENVSKYTANTNTSINYDTSENAYILSQSTAGDLFIDGNSIFELPSNFKFEFDFKHTGSGIGRQASMGINNNGGDRIEAVHITTNNTINAYNVHNGQYATQSSSCALSNDNWYHGEMVVNNGSATFNIKSNDTIIASVTKTNLNLSVTGNNNIFFRVSNVNGSIRYIKNIKVKSL